MRKLLIVVDMQQDFVDGVLGTPEARAIVPKVVEKIKNWDGDVWYTYDTHGATSYPETREGRRLPPHCIYGTSGHELAPEIEAVRKPNDMIFHKNTFGSTTLADFIATKCFYTNEGYDEIEFIGLCTDICVISNALLVHTRCHEVDIRVDASCCAGSTPENHKAALNVMRACQIDIYND